MTHAIANAPPPITREAKLPPLIGLSIAAGASVALWVLIFAARHLV